MNQPMQGNMFTEKQTSKHTVLLLLTIFSALIHFAMTLYGFGMTSSASLKYYSPYGSFWIIGAVIIIFLSLLFIINITSIRVPLMIRILMITTILMFNFADGFNLAIIILESATYTFMIDFQIVDMLASFGIGFTCSVVLLIDYIQALIAISPSENVPLVQSDDRSQLMAPIFRNFGVNKSSERRKLRHTLLLLLIIFFSILHFAMMLRGFSYFSGNNTADLVLWFIFSILIFLLSIVLVINSRTNKIAPKIKLILIALILAFEFAIGVDIAISASINSILISRANLKYSMVDGYYSLELADTVITFVINLTCLAFLYIDSLLQILSPSPPDPVIPYFPEQQQNLYQPPPQPQPESQSQNRSQHESENEDKRRRNIIRNKSQNQGENDSQREKKKSVHSEEAPLQ